MKFELEVSGPEEIAAAAEFMQKIAAIRRGESSPFGPPIPLSTHEVLYSKRQKFEPIDHPKINIKT